MFPRPTFGALHSVVHRLHHVRGCLHLPERRHRRPATLPPEGRVFPGQGPHSARQRGCRDAGKTESVVVP